MNTKVVPYVRLVLGLVLVFLVSQLAHVMFSFFEVNTESGVLKVFFDVSIICVLSFIVFYLTQGTLFPSFVVAIFFGMAAQKLLDPVLHGHGTLNALVGFGATLILFGGGLETPWDNFKKLFWKIFSLAFVGLFATAALFSFTIVIIGNIFGITIPIPVAILLGAILASTDPAAIIPVLKQLRFHNRDTKDIVISESALTDVTGTLLTVIFLSVITSGNLFSSISNGYGMLFTAEAGTVLVRQIFFGVIFGVIGYALLEVLTRFKQRHEKEFEADAAYFLFVPVIIFTIALSLGGSGYLAAFIAGLLFITTEKLHETERFFNHTIDGFLKPMIFILLGALVNPESLVRYIGVGIVAALVFMFVIRPLAVFLSLAPFIKLSKNRMTVQELIFISFVRETGAIPAVLLVTVVGSGIAGLNGLVEIGMWIILITLIVEPPLTPYIAKRLKIADVIEDNQSLTIDTSQEPFVVLGSRGHSFVQRLPKVADWATKHNIKKIVLLHCPEDKYTPKYAQEVETIAKSEFEKINNERKNSAKPELNFSYISRSGFLQKNIDELTKEQSQVTAIFVGRKVLDYRLADIKQLSVPMFFID